jgi:hypothetical protein
VDALLTEGIGGERRKSTVSAKGPTRDEFRALGAIRTQLLKCHAISRQVCIDDEGLHMATVGTNDLLPDDVN